MTDVLVLPPLFLHLDVRRTVLVGWMTVLFSAQSCLPQMLLCILRDKTHNFLILLHLLFKILFFFSRSDTNMLPHYNSAQFFWSAKDFLFIYLFLVNFSLFLLVFQINVLRLIITVA